MIWSPWPKRLTRSKTLRALIDLEDLALTPAVGATSGFLPLQAPGFPVSSDETFSNAIVRTLARVAEGRLFLEALDGAGGRNDDLRAAQLNTAFNVDAETLINTTLTRRAMVLRQSELHELLSVALPRVTAETIDLVVGELRTAGLVAAADSLEASYAPQPLATPSVALQPVFFSLGGMVSASSFRMRIVKKLYVPLLKQVVANLQNLAAEGLLRATLDPAALPGIATGASLSFHSFELGHSFVEAPVFAEHPDGVIVALIGPTLVADLATTLNGIRGVRFNSPKAVKDSFKKIKSTAQKAQATLQAEFKQVTPDGLAQGCIFASDPVCQQLLFESGLPVVHTTGGFPGPVLIVVYDAVSGTVALENFLFFPKR